MSKTNIILIVIAALIAGFLIATLTRRMRNGSSTNGLGTGTVLNTGTTQTGTGTFDAATRMR